METKFLYERIATMAGFGSQSKPQETSESLVYPKNSEQKIFLTGFVLTGLAFSGLESWWPQWACLAFLLSGYIAARIAKKTHALYGWTYLYLCTSALITGLWRQNQFWDWALTDRTILRAQSLEFFTFAALFGAFFTMLPAWGYSKAKPFFTWLFILSGLACVFTEHGGGFLVNKGMNASLMCVLLPFSPFGILGTAFVATIVVLSQASTPVLVFAVVCFFLYKKARFPITAGAFIAAVLIYQFAPDYYNDYTRFHNWSLYWQYMKHNHLLLGSGAGTFLALGPTIQEAPKDGLANWLLWAHNDYLQIAFEYGLAGLGLVLTCIGALLYRARTRPDYQAALLGIMASALTDYPLRLAPMVFVLIILLKEIASERV